MTVKCGAVKQRQSFDTAYIFKIINLTDFLHRLCKSGLFILFLNKQMYGRYTQELGVYAKEEAARLRDGGGLRRNTSVRGRAADVLEFEKDPCTKCQGK